MSEKKYYFFKMEDDFFQKKEIKKLRSIAGGDTFVLIYLKMILKSLKTGGKLYFEGFEDLFADELALEIDENPNNVSVTLEFLLKCGMIQEKVENEYQVNDIGIEQKTSTALRVARWRERNKKNEPLHLNAGVTLKKQMSNGDIDIDIDIEKDIDIYKEQKKVKRVKESFVPPTKQDVINYFKEKGYRTDIAEKAWEYYNEAGWKDAHGKPVLNWKQKMLSNWMKPEYKTAEKIESEKPKFPKPPTWYVNLNEKDVEVFVYHFKEKYGFEPKRGQHYLPFPDDVDITKFNDEEF